MPQSIIEHLETNNLLSPYQDGFMSGRSRSTQLLEVLDIWTQIVEGGDNIDANYLDFAKAFDTVPHRRLLTKNGRIRDW